MPTPPTKQRPRAAAPRQLPSETRINSDENGDRQVKSAERVRDLGEVFTPAAAISEMLDLLPADIWEPHPSPTFLEPSCGDGNFLVGILAYKLRRISERIDEGDLPAGADPEALGFHVLEALASIYAVDISADNVIGGSPGHEIGARDRMFSSMTAWYERQTGGALDGHNEIAESARWIVNRNIQVGNMLPFDAYGRPSGRERIPLIEYSWEPGSRSVTVATTTLGGALSAHAVSSTTVLSLFDQYEEPSVVWSGPVSELRSAPIPEPAVAIDLSNSGNTRR